VLLLLLLLLLLMMMMMMTTAIMILLLLLCTCLSHLLRDAKAPATCSKALAAFLQQQQAGPAQQGQDKQPADHSKQQPFSSFLATVLMLMGELAQGAASKYEPYFQTLPHKTACLMNWTQQEQSLLSGEAETALQSAPASKHPDLQQVLISHPSGKSDTPEAANNTALRFGLSHQPEDTKYGSTTPLRCAATTDVISTRWQCVTLT
jgi:hypothetical protein